MSVVEQHFRAVVLPHLISRAPKVALLQQADSKGLAEREGFAYAISSKYQNLLPLTPV